MKYSFSASFAFAGFVAGVAGHGFVTDPPARQAGKAMAAACGQQVFNNQAADTYGNIQGILQVAKGRSDFNAGACNVWLCKGFQFSDNAANVQTFSAGQTVPITVDIRAPHTGTANVSIVKTSSNSIIGSPLISFDSYASNSAPIPANQKNFDITIPSNLGSQCANPGDCVIQWYWDARSIDQTYEACIDFMVGGSGGSPASSSPASAPTSTTAPTTVLTVVVPSTTSSPAPTALPSTAIPVPAPVPTSSAGNGNGSTLPETFTLDTFIAWLQKTAKSTNNAEQRRSRIHARAF